MKNRFILLGDQVCGSLGMDQKGGCRRQGGQARDGQAYFKALIRRER